MPTVWNINVDSWEIDMLLALLEQERLEPQTNLLMRDVEQDGNSCSANTAESEKFSSKFNPGAFVLIPTCLYFYKIMIIIAICIFLQNIFLLPRLNLTWNLLVSVYISVYLLHRFTHLCETYTI